MKRILADCSYIYTRIVLEQDGQPLEFICENKNKKSLVGNIYVGRVESVLKGMKSCFVDIGMKKNAYLITNEGSVPRANSSILVQITKDAIGEKGPVAEEKISFTGRFSVLIPNDDGRISFSQKIKDQGERERIKAVVKELIPEGYGIIIRTEGEGKSRSEFKNEIAELYSESLEVLKKAQYIKPPCLLREENNAVLSAARDLFSSDVEEFVINDKALYEAAVKNIPDRAERIKLYEGDIPIFESYFVESKLDRLFSKKVWLKSGGFIVIEQTEACVVIDVNTGKFTGKKDFEATKLKTNLEAAEEIALQLRLRNLTGMIIVDFIDMNDEENKKLLEERLKEEVKKDRIKTTVVGMTELGLMQLTRKKTRIPAVSAISEECKGCMGRGIVPAAEYTADKIFKQISSVFVQTVFNEVTVCTNRRLIKALNAENGRYIKETENKFGKKIALKEIETGAADYFELEKRKI